MKARDYSDGSPSFGPRMPTNRNLLGQLVNVELEVSRVIVRNRMRAYERSLLEAQVAQQVAA